MTQTDDARGPTMLQAIQPDDWPDTVHVGKAVIKFPNGVESGNWYSRASSFIDETLPFTRAHQPDPLTDPRVAALVEAVTRLVANLDEGDFISTTRIEEVRAALAAFNTTDKPQGANNEVKGGKADD